MYSEQLSEDLRTHARHFRAYLLQNDILIFNLKAEGVLQYRLRSLGHEGTRITSLFVREYDLEAFLSLVTLSKPLPPPLSVNLIAWIRYIYN
jgi:hypothetical protein